MPLLICIACHFRLAITNRSFIVSLVIFETLLMLICESGYPVYKGVSLFSLVLHSIFISYRLNVKLTEVKPTIL